VLSFPSRIGFAGTQTAAAEADLPKPLAAGETEHFVEPDELAIYGWINPTKVPEEVRRERHRMVALQAIRYGIHHYLDDIWQEWQLAVHQCAQAEPLVPVEQREAFSFGIARNLCRSYLRKDRGMIPLLNPSAPPEEGVAGIRERELADRRADRPSEPKYKPPEYKPPEPEVGSEWWSRTENLNECIGKLRPRAQQVLQKTYFDGKASHEVGLEMGLSPENVRQQLRRARDELRHCMATPHGRSERKDWRHADIN
jgi:RNA polymerase sigma factor (sigma-70 family)